MGSDGWDEPPLDIQIPDDARDLDRDVLAYHRELRAQRRRRALKRLAGPLARNGAIMPLLASILAICLVAGAMLSVATFSPAPGVRTTSRPTASAATTTTTRPPSPRPPRASATAAPRARPPAARPGTRPRPSRSTLRTSGPATPAGTTTRR